MRALLHLLTEESGTSRHAVPRRLSVAFGAQPTLVRRSRGRIDEATPWVAANAARLLSQWEREPAEYAAWPSAQTTIATPAPAIVGLGRGLIGAQPWSN